MPRDANLAMKRAGRREGGRRALEAVDELNRLRLLLVVAAKAANAINDDRDVLRDDDGEALALLLYEIEKRLGGAHSVLAGEPCSPPDAA